MSEALITLPSGQKIRVTGKNQQEVISKAENIASQVSVPDIGSAATLGEFGLRRFLNNFTALPQAIGTGAAHISALSQTGLNALQGEVDDFGDTFNRNLEVQKQVGLGGALRSIPAPTVTDVQATAAGLIPGGMSADEARMAGETRLDTMRQQHPLSAMGGEALGDAATILTGRVPIARARAPKLTARREKITQDALNDPLVNLPKHVREQLEDTFADRILPALGRGGKGLARGAGRAAETGLEGAVLSLIHDGDPVSTFALGAGGQAVGSLGLWAVTNPIKGLAPAVATAAVAHNMYRAAGPGEKRILESVDFATDKAVAAFALGLTGALMGAGRLQGKAAEQLPVLMDAITSVPRGAVLSRIQELTNSTEQEAALPIRVLEQFSTDPSVFTKDQQKALARALTSDKQGAFIKEVNRLSKNDRFMQSITVEGER